MSMDDILERAGATATGLALFNDRLKTAFAEVEHAHQNVSPLWDDTMRTDYDRTWIPLEEDIKEYSQRIGPRYVETLTERLKHLHNYLHGS